MPTSDLSEKGLESLIVESLVANAGYVPGHNQDFDRDHALNLAQFTAFITTTQPDAVTGELKVRHLAPASVAPTDNTDDDVALVDDIENEDAMAEDESDLIEEASS